MGNEEVGVSIASHVATVELRRPPNNFLDVDFIGSLASVLEAVLSGGGGMSSALSSAKGVLP